MDHVRDPLGVAAQCFRETWEKSDVSTTSASDWGVPLSFWRYLAKEGVKNVKPISQEALAQGRLESNTLVRFRGFVQSTFNPEMYAPILRLRNQATKEEKVLPFRYRDSFTPEPGVDVVHEGQADRQTLYCLEIPGENDWVAEHAGEDVEVAGEEEEDVDFEGEDTDATRPKRPWDDAQASDSSASLTGKGADTAADDGMGPPPPVTTASASSTAAHAAAFTGPAFKVGTASRKTGRKARQRRGKKGGKGTTGGGSGADGMDPHVTSLGKFHPQPHESRLACMVHMYEQDAAVKIGDMVEFFGVYTFDPSEGLGAVPNSFLPPGMKYDDPLMAGPGSRARSAVATSGGSGGAGGDGQRKAQRSEGLSGTFGSGTGWGSSDPMASMMAPSFPEHDYMRQPPHSLVPRLHAIVYRKLCSAFPLLQPSPLLKGPYALLPPPGPSEPETKTAKDAESLSAASVNTLKELTQKFSRSLSDIRELVVKGLMPFVGDDGFAVQYVLLNLISYVEARPYDKPLGALSVNVMGYPEFEGPVAREKPEPWLKGRDPRTAASPYAKEIDAALQSITQRSVVVPCSIQYLSTVPLYPIMNYTTERLEAGALQLPSGTHVLVDETVLSEGNLGDMGVKNIRALESVTQLQKLPYDFQYSQQEFLVDLPVLSISTGKGVMPVQANVPLSEEAKKTLRTSDAPTFGPPTDRESYLEMCRVYLASVRLLNVTIPEAVKKMVEDDLVEARRRFPSLLPDDLHVWMTVAKLLAKSNGQTELDEATWIKTRELETERLKRMAYIASQRRRAEATR